MLATPIPLVLDSSLPLYMMLPHQSLMTASIQW